MDRVPADEFAAAVGAACGGSRRRTVILACARGGTLRTTVKTRQGRDFADPDLAFGIESRSLKAALVLLEAGFKDVRHLEGGTGAWKAAGGDCSWSYERGRQPLGVLAALKGKQRGDA